MTTEIWLTHNNGAEKMMFPVNPSKMTIKSETAHSTVTVRKLGEVTILQAPKLKEVFFEGFFPTQNAPYVRALNEEGLLQPKQYVDMINKWKDAERPSRLIVTSDIDGHSVQSAMDINTPVSIDYFEVYEDGGDVGVARFSISFKEYKFITTRKIDVKKDEKTGQVVANTKGTQRPNEKANTEKPKTYTVVSGDSLIAIGKKTGINWKDIATKNKIMPPYTIYPKQVLKL